MSFWDRFRWRRIDREVDEEMAFHLDMRTEENLRAGMSPEEARREALLRFGNLTATREEARETRGVARLEAFVRDLRQGARGLRRRPGFAAAAVLTLALGIGAGTAVFSVVDAVLLRPLPYREPDRLVKMVEVHAERPSGAVAAANFLDWEKRSTSFDSMAAYFNWSMNLTGVDSPERLRATLVTGHFFEVLGVTPLLGRLLEPADDRIGFDDVVVLSERLWRRRFHADPDIAGKRILIDGELATVAGVLPAASAFPDEQTDLWTPAAFRPDRIADRKAKFTWVIARLGPAVDLAEARAEMDAVAATLANELPASNAGYGVKVTPLAETIVGAVRPTLLVLLGAVGLLLLLACANVANLLLARAASREREVALRIALGASRGRLATQFLAESAVLALLGGVAGAVLAWFAVDLLAALNPGNIPRLADAAVDGRALAITLAVASASVLLVGVAPAWWAAHAGPGSALRAGSRTTPGRTLARQMLVAAQVAVALVLLVGAGLLARSFARLVAVDPGFDPHHLLAASVSLPTSRYQDSARQIAFLDELVTRAGALPGVRAVGAVQDLPVRRNSMTFELTVEGHPGASPPMAANRVVTPAYHEIMGIPVLAGRGLTRGDVATAPPVIVVNQTLARTVFPGENPIGRRVKFGGRHMPWRTIVGVVGDVKHMGLDGDDGAAMYQPLAQKPEWLRWTTLLIRTDGDPAAMAASLRAAIAGLDRDLPIYDVTTMDEVIARSVASRRFILVLIAVFAAAALALALVGVYGVLAYWVTQRTREIGIHLALGAQRRDILRLVLGRGLKLALGGLAVGLMIAVIAARALEKLLFDVPPTDPATYAGVSLILVIAAALACALPARRASRVDPASVLDE